MTWVQIPCKAPQSKFHSFVLKIYQQELKKDDRTNITASFNRPFQFLISKLRKKIIKNFKRKRKLHFKTKIKRKVWKFMTILCMWVAFISQMDVSVSKKSTEQKYRRGKKYLKWVYITQHFFLKFMRRSWVYMREYIKKNILNNYP